MRTIRKSEVNRFLNHVESVLQENQINAKRETELVKWEKDAANKELACARAANEVLRTMHAQELAGRHNAETRLAELTEAVRSLMPRIRANVNTGRVSPRWFESTDRWWSRETGGLDAEFVGTMTTEELVEALNFYANPETDLLLPRSNRDVGLNE